MVDSKYFVFINNIKLKNLKQDVSTSFHLADND